MFTIDDGCQGRVELASNYQNVIAATFNYFLLKNIGGSETFKDKQDFFYHEIRKLHHKHHHERIALKIYRDKIVESSMRATKSFSTSDWCKHFVVSFIGEEGKEYNFELQCCTTSQYLKKKCFIRCRLWRSS